MRCLRLVEIVLAAKKVLPVAKRVGSQGGEGRGVPHYRGARGTAIFYGAGAVPHSPPAHAVRRLPPSRRVATVISHELVVGGIDRVVGAQLPAVVTGQRVCTIHKGT